MDMKLVDSSSSLKTFLDDKAFSRIKAKEVANVNQHVV